MYLVNLKTMLREATYSTLDSEYVVPEFRNIHVSLEFPDQPQHYPGIWVDFSPVTLVVSGVGHVEYADPSQAGTSRAYTRWRFGGEATFTVVALTSLERDRLYDEMVRILAFGQEASATAQFRSYIQNNEFIAADMDWDNIKSRGFSQSVGTPWQTDEMLYEGEVAMQCFGEFVSDNQTATLIPLSAVTLYPYSDLETDPTSGDGWQ